jgi:signal transduction histidine kinase
MAQGGSELEAVGVAAGSPSSGATAGPTTGLDVLEQVESAARELARHQSVPDVIEAALRLAVDLTRSPVAFLALLEPDGGPDKRVYTLAKDPADGLPRDEIERIFAAAGAQNGSPATGTPWRAVTDTVAPALRSTCAEPLAVGGRSLGTIGVASPAGYSAAQQAAFAIFALQVASAISAATTAGRRQEMVDTLVNLRADLDRSERQRLINEERARNAERVEHAHEAAVDALLAVSRHARSGHGITDFYRRLTRSIAELVAADKVLFWKLDEQDVLAPIAGGYGVDADFTARLKPYPCARDRDDIASRVVFHDLMFRASRTDLGGDFLFVLDRLNVQNAIAVPWRAGDQRLGLVAAFDSRRPDGFSREDAWVLHKAGLAAGLVWQLRYAETDLKRTVERLHKVDAARQMLLTNVSTAVDKARKRFAGDLHDDALQKLTAAEIHLQRLHQPNGDGEALLNEAQALLMETEEALRRLLFEVRPPALEVPGGFIETIRERIRMLRSVTGAEVESEVDLPDDLSYEYRSMLFRQLTEAMANIEKHAAATRVEIRLREHEGGIHGVVKDDGRGFVLAERERLPGHLGLLALQERALLAGGWNKIVTEPGFGTTIEFWLPLTEARVDAPDSKV